MKDDIVNGQRVRCYDNGGRSCDRYTAVYMGMPYYTDHDGRTYNARGMDAQPFHPQGFGQLCSAQCGRHLGLRIRFDQLPDDCQKLVRQDTGGMT